MIVAEVSVTRRFHYLRCRFQPPRLGSVQVRRRFLLTWMPPATARLGFHELKPRAASRSIYGRPPAASLNDRYIPSSKGPFARSSNGSARTFRRISRRTFLRYGGNSGDSCALSSPIGLAWMPPTLFWPQHHSRREVRLSPVSTYLQHLQTPGARA